MFLEQRTRPLVRAPGAGRGAPAASPASLCAGADRTAASMPGKEQLGAGAGGDVCGKDPQPPDTCWGHGLAPTPPVPSSDHVRPSGCSGSSAARGRALTGEGGRGLPVARRPPPSLEEKRGPGPGGRRARASRARGLGQAG